MSLEAARKGLDSVTFTYFHKRGLFNRYQNHTFAGCSKNNVLYYYGKQKTTSNQDSESSLRSF